MRELDQLLLNFNFSKNYKKDDFFVSKSNFFAFNLIDLGQNGKKILLIFVEKNIQEKHIYLKFF
tara:strand:- start:586 stop:777 length:192 start_codon:yes stop_codon:yes gene_type:complete